MFDENEKMIIAARQIGREDATKLIQSGEQVWYITGLYNQYDYVLVKVDEGMFEALKDIFNFDGMNNGWFVDLKEFRSGDEQTFVPGNWRFFKKYWFDECPVIETENDLYKIFKPEIRKKKKEKKK